MHSNLVRASSASKADFTRFVNKVSASAIYLMAISRVHEFALSKGVKIIVQETRAGKKSKRVFFSTANFEAARFTPLTENVSATELGNAMRIVCQNGAKGKIGKVDIEHALRRTDSADRNLFISDYLERIIDMLSLYLPVNDLMDFFRVVYWMKKPKSCIYLAGKNSKKWGRPISKEIANIKSNIKAFCEVNIPLNDLKAAFDFFMKDRRENGEDSHSWGPIVKVLENVLLAYHEKFKMDLELEMSPIFKTYFKEAEGGFLNNHNGKTIFISTVFPVGVLFYDEAGLPCTKWDLGIDIRSALYTIVLRLKRISPSPSRLFYDLSNALDL